MLRKNQVAESHTHAMSDRELLSGIYNHEIDSYENEIKEKQRELENLELNLPSYENRFNLLAEKHKKARAFLPIENVIITLAGLYIGFSISQTIFYRHEEQIMSTITTFAPGAMHLFVSLVFAIIFGILGALFNNTYMTKLAAKVERSRRKVEKVRNKIADSKQRISILNNRVKAKKQEKHLHEYGYSNVTS